VIGCLLLRAMEDVKKENVEGKQMAVGNVNLQILEEILDLCIPEEFLNSKVEKLKK